MLHAGKVKIVHEKNNNLNSWYVLPVDAVRKSWGTNNKHLLNYKMPQTEKSRRNISLSLKVWSWTLNWSAGCVGLGIHELNHYYSPWEGRRRKEVGAATILRKCVWLRQTLSPMLCVRQKLKVNWLSNWVDKCKREGERKGRTERKRREGEEELEGDKKGKKRRREREGGRMKGKQGGRREWREWRKKGREKRGKKRERWKEEQRKEREGGKKGVRKTRPFGSLGTQLSLDWHMAFILPEILAMKYTASSAPSSQHWS